MSRDEHGAPRLIRSIVPRAGIPGAAPELAARDHVAALAPLWVKNAAAMPLVERGSQQLRNGATIVQLAQEVDGVMVDQGELRVLLYADGSLAAVSGTLLPAAAAPAFVSSPRDAVEHALDQQYGSARAALAIREGAEVGGWQTLEIGSAPQLQVDEARARRVLATIDDQLTQAWEVELIGDPGPADPLSESSPAMALAAHSYLVEDGGGKILRNTDLVAHDAFVYRAYMETTGNRRPLDGPLQSFAPIPPGCRMARRPA